MQFDSTNEMFNVSSLTLGCAMLLLCLVIHAFFVLLVTTKFKNSIQAFVHDKKRIKAQITFYVSIIVLLVSHLIQIYVWGQFLYRWDIIDAEHHAMVFAGSTYTTVGFTSDPLPIGWQLLTIIMAVSGVFSFGWSTAIMFLLSQTLFPSEN